LLCVTAGLLLAADPPRKDEPPKEGVKDPELRKELLARMKEDQDFRKQMMELFQKKAAGAGEAVDKELKTVVEQGQGIDRKNTAWLKPIIERQGWPGVSLVGKDGGLAAWLLVQHADLDPAFQKRCLPLLAEAVHKKEASGQHLAYLTDRVRLADKQKQLYGTQVRLVNGKAEPQPIEDEANVDRRRKEVGLPPLAEYLKVFEDRGKSKETDKASPKK
jgi:hypothetical protein